MKDRGKTEVNECVLTGKRKDVRGRKERKEKNRC